MAYTSRAELREFVRELCSQGAFDPSVRDELLGFIPSDVEYSLDLDAMTVIRTTGHDDDLVDGSGWIRPATREHLAEFIGMLYRRGEFGADVRDRLLGELGV